MRDARCRGRWVRNAGLLAAGPVLSFSLCPVAEKHDEIDVNEYAPSNAVGRLAFSYVASGDATVALTGVQATGEVGSVGVENTLALTGVQATAAIGSVGVDNTSPLKLR